MACNVRERNGYGIVTTQYSITSIGRNFEGGHAAKSEKAEAAVRTFEGRSSHHASCMSPRRHTHHRPPLRTTEDAHALPPTTILKTRTPRSFALIAPPTASRPSAPRARLCARPLATSTHASTPPHLDAPPHLHTSTPPHLHPSMLHQLASPICPRARLPAPPLPRSLTHSLTHSLTPDVTRGPTLTENSARGRLRNEAAQARASVEVGALHADVLPRDDEEPPGRRDGGLGLAVGLSGQGRGRAVARLRGGT